MKVAVSGPVDPKRPRGASSAAQLVKDTLSFLAAGHDELYSGSAHGIDSYAVLAARDYNARVTLVVPEGNWYNREAEGDATIVVPARSSSAATYMARNFKLAELADVLYAFPQTENEEQRSGTWATIRRFQAFGKSVWITPLDGSEPHCLVRRTV